MKQTDAERLDKLAEEYSTNSDYCRHMAEIVRYATLLPKSIGCGLQSHGPHWRRRPRQDRVRQTLPFIDSETPAGESFPEGWVGSGQPSNRASGFGKPSKRHSGSQMNVPRLGRRKRSMPPILYSSRIGAWIVGRCAAQWAVAKHWPLRVC